MVTKSKKPNKQYMLLFLSGAFAVALAIYLGARQIMIVQEKAKFEAATVELESLSKQVQDGIGKADEVSLEKSCDRQSRKYSDGPLSCTLDLSLEFKSMDLQQANDALATLRDNFGNDSLRSSSTYTKETKFIKYVAFPDPNYNAQRDIQTLAQDHAGIHGLSCYISYGYPTNKELSTGFRVSVICYGSALAEHYSPQYDDY